MFVQKKKKKKEEKNIYKVQKAVVADKMYHRRSHVAVNLYDLCCILLELLRNSNKNIVPTAQYWDFDCFHPKRLNYFWKSVDAILEDVSVTEKNHLMLNY